MATVTQPLAGRRRKSSNDGERGPAYAALAPHAACSMRMAAFLQCSPAKGRERRFTMAQALPIKKQESIFDEMDKMRERIRCRAYDIFQMNGEASGKDLENWLQAEQELVWKPAIELEEKDKEFRLQVAVPGVEPDDIDIEVTAEDILVKAEIQSAQNGDILTTEFPSGNLFRSVHLPKRIETDKVTAEVNNGMLTLKARIAADALTERVKVQAA
jgi:HSP20 family protein